MELPLNIRHSAGQLTIGVGRKFKGKMRLNEWMWLRSVEARLVFDASKSCWDKWTIIFSNISGTNPMQVRFRRRRKTLETRADANAWLSFCLPPSLAARWTCFTAPVSAAHTTCRPTSATARSTSCRSPLWQISTTPSSCCSPYASTCSRLRPSNWCGWQRWETGWIWCSSGELWKWDADDRRAGWMFVRWIRLFIYFLKASVWRSALLVGPGDRLLQELLSADNRAVSHDLWDWPR